MIKSLNEVYRQCQKAVEGAGAPTGVDSETARAVVWLLSRDLPALDELVSALSLFADEGERACRIVHDRLETPDLNLDVSGKAGVLIAPGLVDLLTANAARYRQTAAMTVLGLTATLFLLPRAAFYQSNGWRFEFTLIDSRLRRFHLSTKASNELLALATDPATFTLQATCSRSTPAAPEGIQLVEGIAVELAVWAQLQRFADRVLVPASALSREHGAGHTGSEQ